MGLDNLRGAGGLAAAGLVLALMVNSKPGMPFYAGPAVDLGKYAGLWHEIARTPNRFQDNAPRKDGRRFSACYNVTADYARAGDGRISITNTCSRKAADGVVVRDTARGIAVVIGESGNRRLQVAFGGPIARFFQRLFAPSEGNYWIRCLGPEADGRYSWSVVSDNRGKLIWFLAREPSLPEDVKAKMHACAREAGLPVGDLIYTQRPE